MGFRAKLILSYTAIIFITLAAAVGLFAYVAGQIQNEQTQQSVNRLRKITDLVGDAIRKDIPASGSLEDYQQILELYSEFVGVRILLVDSSGRVRADSDQTSASLRNQVIPSYQLVPRDNTVYQRSIILGGVSYIYYAKPGPGIRRQIGQNNPPSEIQKVLFNPLQLQTSQTFLESDLWLAVPETQIKGPWNNFLAGLVITGALVLLGGFILAFFIGRSISRPLLRMTRASIAIAEGNYTQQITVKSNDEIGQLAASFNQMAREVARSQQTMRDFVANVSHELKTPLTSIQGFSQALVEGVADDPDAIQHSSKVILREAGRMRRLVDELLDLSRIESGQIILNKHEVDLTQLLSRIVDKLELLAEARYLKLQMRRNDHATVTGDPDRLEQVFTNLVDNAIKYGASDTIIWVDIMVQTPTESEGRGAKNQRGPLAVVQIANLGPIIPPEELPRIFERFYKLDRSRQRKTESTGIGLAIVRELVEAHHGAIYVTSQALENNATSGYTIFKVELPLATTTISAVAK